MMLRRIESLDEYAALLDSDPAELAALFQDFLIRVTEFFRDPDRFDALRQSCFPRSVKAVPESSPSGSGCPAARPARRSIPSPSPLLEYLGDRPPR